MSVALPSFLSQDSRAGAAEADGKLSRSPETLRHQSDMPPPLCIPHTVTVLRGKRPLPGTYSKLTPCISYKLLLGKSPDTAVQHQQRTALHTCYWYPHKQPTPWSQWLRTWEAELDRMTEWPSACLGLVGNVGSGLIWESADYCTMCFSSERPPIPAPSVLPTLPLKVLCHPIKG